MDKERQSGIPYLHTERSISQETGYLVRCPIRVFNLYGLGIDQERFLSDLAPSFNELGWDQYEACLRRVNFLKERFPEHRERLDDFLPVYYDQGDAAIWQIRDLLHDLAWEDKYFFDQIRSYRRRSIARFLLTNRFHATWEDQWHVEKTEMEGFQQEVDPNDPRKLRRIFDPTSAKVIEHPGFQRLLVAIAEMVEDAEQDFEHEPEEMVLTFHQMGLVARPREQASNAPEGAHKDGADYIVSALVVLRSGVEGGTSVVLADDRKTKLLEVTLGPGEGLFQADRFSQLWHDVTPIRLKETAWGEAEEGVRNIFGFDIQVTERRR